MGSFVIAGLIFLVAGFVQGITGFGAGLVAIPLLCLIIDVKTAVPLVILNGVIITSYLAYTLRSFLDSKKILPLLVGSIPGVLLGSQCLTLVNPDLIRTFLGILLIAYSVYNLAAHPKPVKMPLFIGYAAGFCTGFITALLSAGGPPAIIYTTLTDWKKNEIKATLTGFFVFNAVFTMIVHALSGMTTLLTLKYCTVTMPLVLLGTAIGSRLTDKINRRAYLICIYVFLLMMGALMVWG
ncbi:sulfite exporter TauE/SafE family protein [Desulfogranum marinum]|jgi:uncharacterized membrane protein YfcA|uniref:sulfite exporter TauE/SafE family protein n=1 Tax=Desulfogranum marinum TaxID=453220 RepID=UPI001964BB6C|nr:sulfite exporter TauE/SafE family protein [Desulfogranum marinum]MBM9514367.1 sulfite exporter TauE/SafE family protein [Desulfogranum marinum]